MLSISTGSEPSFAQFELNIHRLFCVISWFVLAFPLLVPSSTTEAEAVLAQVDSNIQLLS